MITFSPITIILGLGLVYLIMKRTRKRTNKHSYIKKVQLMTAGYVVILLACVGVYYVLPKDAHLQAEQVSPKQTFGMLYQAADKGEIGNLDDKYLLETWNIGVNGQEVKVNVAGDSDSLQKLPIFVEKVEKQDDLIEASFYRTPLLIEGYDFSKRQNPLKINYYSGALHISPPSPAVIKLSLFKKEFPITQFIGENWKEATHSSNEQLLYMKVPENIKLKFENGNQVIYVD